MIYYSAQTQKWETYANVVKFTSSEDGPQEAYCNDIQDYVEMVKTYPYKFSNLTSQPVVLSQEQATRLEWLNTVEGATNTYESEVVLFVKEGAILPTTLSTFLSEVAADYATTTEAYIQSLQENVWVNIKAIRDEKISNGGHCVDGKWYHSDTVSRSQQTGLYLMGEGVPAGLMWKTMDGSFVEMTPVLAQKIFFAAAGQDSVLFQYAESLRQQVKASTDPEQVDIMSNWPTTFQTSTENAVGAE